MGKVISRIKGGLGNQLFCYAAARRLALINNAELVIDDVTGFARDSQYRRSYMLDCFNIPAQKATPAERLEPFERYRRGLAKWLSRGKPFAQRSYLEQEGLDFDTRLLNVKVRGTVYLDGLWQSEQYFKDVEATIREDLRIIPPTDALNQAMARRIRACNAVALHVRWFDDPSNGKASHNASKAYYDHAMEEIRRQRQVINPHFFLFSDDPVAAQQLFELTCGQATCVNHNRGDENAYADLWLMTQCKHFIIANSTFSWWGAWLADENSKIVICPAMQFSREKCVTAWGFEGLIPDEWIQLT